MKTYIIKPSPCYFNENETVNDISIKKIDKYLKNRLDELDSMAHRGDPWVFGACCTYIDMLALHVYYDHIFNGNPLPPDANPPTPNPPRDSRCMRKTGKADFMRLCKNFLFPVNRKYQSRAATLNPQEMEWMLYVVLRCGALHKFSMKTEREQHGKAEPFSIVLGHRKNFEDNADHHLEYVKLDLDDGNSPRQSMLLIAESFIDDLRKCTELIIKKASKTAQLTTTAPTPPSVLSHFVESFKNESPIGWFLFDDN